MQLTVYSNLSVDAAKKFANLTDRAGRAIAEEIRKDTSPYVPYLSGTLDNGTRVVGNLVIYPPPYARYLYYGKVMVSDGNGHKVATDRDLVFTKDFHPQAQAFWFEASKAQNAQKWCRIAQKAVKHGAG